MTERKVCGFLAASGEVKGWKEIPTAGLIVKAGNSEEYYTGGWRTFRPLVDKKRCTNCMICWIYCPDTSIIAKDGNMEGFDFEHCKGCKICAEVCPIKCIKTVNENDFKEINKNNDYDQQGRTSTVEINLRKPKE